MPVKVRSGKWHYRFHVNGKSYSGVCLDCETLRQAEKFEADVRKKVNEIRAHKSVQSIIEDYRAELTGAAPVPLKDASRLAFKKPAKKIPSAKYIQQSNRYWEDFYSFMAATYPEVEHLAQVRKTHCEAYIAYLAKNGRFDKTIRSSVQYRRSRSMAKEKSEIRVTQYTHKAQLIAPKTIKAIATIIKWVFRVLAEDAGITLNPMDNVVLPAGDPVSREIFTEDELAQIREGIKDDPFCHPLFTVAALTGLTEGDICTLRWDEVDTRLGCIRRKRRKTGVWLEIPLTPALEQYIFSRPRVSDYIFPEHAHLYLNSRYTVPVRVKAFLDRLGIENVKKIEGRRAVSVKDLHSMRHVFCYYAGQAGIPITTVQSIIGHLTPEMTRHYSRHDSLESKARALAKLPLFLSLNDSDNEEAVLRSKLSELAYHIPLDRVKELLAEFSE